MNRVGWIGLGKLGFPCAMALHQFTGIQICGHDPHRRVELETYFSGKEYPYREAEMQDMLNEYREKRGGGFILMKNTREVINALPDHGVLFLSVQTPHDNRFGGESPMPEDTADFEYAYLETAVREVVTRSGDKPLTLVIISTVLPGTIARVIKPILTPNITLLYNPFFIAMGTTVADFVGPEFVLVGADNPADAKPLVDMYSGLHEAPIKIISIESAELAKVAYNTFISMKIVFANTMMEICEKTAADCDEVYEALALAKERVVSPAYLRGGMGDGGHCHPRDNIAMSHLAKKLGLSFDLMGIISKGRDLQATYLAQLMVKWYSMTGHPLVILGKAYKPESDLTGGSPALLVRNLLANNHIDVVQVDPVIDDGEDLSIMNAPCVFLIGTKHRAFQQKMFAEGSVVIDPFGYIYDQPGVTVIRLGRK